MPRANWHSLQKKQNRVNRALYLPASFRTVCATDSVTLRICRHCRFLQFMFGRSSYWELRGVGLKFRPCCTVHLFHFVCLLRFFLFFVLFSCLFYSAMAKKKINSFPTGLWARFVSHAACAIFVVSLCFRSTHHVTSASISTFLSKEPSLTWLWMVSSSSTHSTAEVNSFVNVLL